MATVKELIARHNELAAILETPALTGWKQAGSKLEEKIAGMEAQVEAQANDADQALVTSALDGTLMASLETDPLGDAPTEFIGAEADEAESLGENDPLVLTEQPDPLETEEKVEDEVIGDVLDVVEAIKAEKTKGKGKKAKAPKVVDERGTIGQMVKDLLLDAEGYDYQEILDIVKGEFPEAHTSRRSIASVAADLRRKGTEVPMRRKQKEGSK